MKKELDWQVQNIENKRSAGDTSYTLQNPTALQEISITGAYSFLHDKFTNFYSKYHKTLLQIVLKREITSFFITIADSFLTLLGYGIIFYNTILGLVTLGTVTYQIRVLAAFSDAMGNILSSFSFLSEYALKVNDLVILSEMRPIIQDGKTKLPRLKTPPSIEFKNVAFKYPGSERYLFEDLNLKIASGEKVAIFGHNGAGKTTIIKLLARIYGVTSGEILINGININELSIADWYKNIGILFQDYNFYSHLSVKDNIFLGKSLKEIDEKLIYESAENADAQDFIKDYPNKYEEIMSEKYKGGTRPSTGQQQKIAIARFFYRNAPLAIFDEPTAAIDAVSEYKIFNKIYNFFNKKTVVIVSHRFSTVRSADRILVIEKGNIVEEGSHSDLIVRKGVYFNAYNLQAEGYQN